MGGIIFVTPGEFAGQHKKLPVKLMRGFGNFMVSSCICQLEWDGPVSIAMMDVCFLCYKEHSGEIAGVGMRQQGGGVIGYGRILWPTLTSGSDLI